MATVQIILSVLIIGLILLQERQTGLSGLLGGEGQGIYQTRRGFERIIFGATIVFSVAFVGLAIAELVI